MPLFESKPKLSIEECCRQFYDSNIFHAIMHDTDVWASLLDTYFESISEVDQSFLSVDSTLFRNEMTALRMELFAFALECSRRYHKEKYTIPQSFFTRSYLKENKKLRIWDAMGKYNEVIARSATMNRNGEPTPGAIGRAQVTLINGTRANVASKWYQTNINNKDITKKDKDQKIDCAVRVFNHLGADTKREDDVVVKLLASKCANRLGCNVNLKYEALFRLEATIFGFYKGAEDYLKSVDLQG